MLKFLKDCFIEPSTNDRLEHIHQQNARENVVINYHRLIDKCTVEQIEHCSYYLNRVRSNMIRANMTEYSPGTMPIKFVLANNKQLIVKIEE